MTIRSRILIVVAIIVVILAAAWAYFGRGDTAQLSVEAVTGVKPQITAPRVQSIPTVDVADVIGWQGAAKPVAAPGLSVNAFAADLDHPRWLYELPNGDVLVAETNSPPRPSDGVKGFVMKTLMSKAGAGAVSPNRILLLRDTNGDGVADFRSVLLSGLESPFGMALVGDKLYVGNHNALVAFPFKVGDTKITAPAQKIVALPGGGNHWAKNIVVDPTGKLLYIGVGSSTNIADNGMDAEKNRANILEYNLETHKIRIYAAGLRNPVGMAWEPKSKQLWTVVNERDLLGSDLAPDYLTLVELGAFYGWPYSYWGGYEDPRVESHPELLQYTRRPDYALGPHTASLGLAFGSLGSFKDGAFIGQHGSWNRKPVSGYKVAFVHFGARGFPEGKLQDVLTGFLDKDGKAQGRPVGVIVDKADSLLVADDVGNRIWRVSAAR
jgi:glucose/arabinose dehydrogenase